jgi:hypothetical protein
MSQHKTQVLNRRSLLAASAGIAVSGCGGGETQPGGGGSGSPPPPATGPGISAGVPVAISQFGVVSRVTGLRIDGVDWLLGADGVRFDAADSARDLLPGMTLQIQGGQSGTDVARSSGAWSNAAVVGPIEAIENIAASPAEFALRVLGVTVRFDAATVDNVTGGRLQLRVGDWVRVYGYPGAYRTTATGPQTSFVRASRIDWIAPQTFAKVVGVVNYDGCADCTNRFKIGSATFNATAASAVGVPFPPGVSSLVQLQVNAAAGAPANTATRIERWQQPLLVGGLVRMRGFIVTGPEVAVGGSVRYAMNGWALIAGTAPFEPTRYSATTLLELEGVEQGGAIRVERLLPVA